MKRIPTLDRIFQKSTMVMFLDQKMSSDLVFPKEQRLYDGSSL